MALPSSGLISLGQVRDEVININNNEHELNNLIVQVNSLESDFYNFRAKSLFVPITYINIPNFPEITKYIEDYCIIPIYKNFYYINIYHIKRGHDGYIRTENKVEFLVLSEISTSSDEFNFGNLKIKFNDTSYDVNNHEIFIEVERLQNNEYEDEYDFIYVTGSLALNEEM